MANDLGLRKREVNTRLKGVENIESQIKYVTSTNIRSRYSKTNFNLSFLVFKEISGLMPAIPIDKNALRIPENLFLADVSFHKQSDIDILIGAEQFYNLIRAGKIRIKNQPSILQETEFGWILAGRYISPQNAKMATEYPSEISCNLIKFYELPILWELGEETLSKSRSDEENAAESIYVETTKRDETGRYVVRLPFNSKRETLGDSRNTAFQRFYALEKRLAKNSDVKSQYVNCIDTCFQEGHIFPLDNQEISKPGYYLPHQAVIRADSLTTKVRVVFDGSAKSLTGVSLNDTFLIGPTIQEDLFSIVTRFRSFPYAMTADIEQMYRQVRVSAEDSLFQRILWRKDPNDPIKMYALRTVTFGTSCAPFLAIRTLHKLAEDERESFPVASTILKRDFYVNDLLTGAQSLQEAHRLRDDLINLLRRGGFNLRKWASNYPELCRNTLNETSEKFFSIDPSETIKALGTHWEPGTDSILYTVNLKGSTDKATKRTILSEIPKLFDPLGLLGPVILIGKILIQQFWKLKLNWDDPVPSDLNEEWVNYKTQLPSLNCIRFPRCITLENTNEVQIHGFCDASEKAYGACLYFRSTDSQDIHRSTLICSKSRVVPIKTRSLPKLELCAATLLVQLYNAAVQSLQIKFAKTVFWSDATIVLNWINSPPHTLPTFKANRVANIQATTLPQDWHHVRTYENPADFISRRHYPQEFLNNSLWTYGPDWLCKDEMFWPKFNFKNGTDEDTIQHTVSLKITKDLPFWTEYSSLKRLQVTVAYCLRFMKNARNKTRDLRLRGPLSREELNLAHKVIIKKIQSDAFPIELYALTNKKELDRKSLLICLNPFLDQGIIKVGGRLDRADLPEIQNTPFCFQKVTS